jgi:hypothetical protein
MTQWASCGSIFGFLRHGWETFSGFVWLNLFFTVSWLVDFNGVRVAQYLDFCVKSLPAMTQKAKD